MIRGEPYKSPKKENELIVTFLLRDKDKAAITNLSCVELFDGRRLRRALLTRGYASWKVILETSRKAKAARGQESESSEGKKNF